MWELENQTAIYQAGYYMKGHPEKCFLEFFCAENYKNALDHVKEMNNSGKFVFELNKQVTVFKTIKEWKE